MIFKLNFNKLWILGNFAGKISAQVPTSLCIRSFRFKKTIAITIDALWECSALFGLLRGFFSKSIWT